MNEIIITNTALPIVSGCSYLAAAEPFFHADRTAPFNILIYVTDGEINVTEDDTDYSVQSGELLFLKKGVHHYGKKAIPKGTRWHFCHFDFNAEDDYPDITVGCSPIEQYNPVRYSLKLPKMLTGLTGSVIEQHIAEFTESYACNDAINQWNINRRLFDLLTDIGLWENNITKPLTLSDRICRFLSDNADTPFSASKIENVFFLSYKHMAAVFKREKGMTMQQYHTAVRMEEAAKLLSSTMMTVGEISEKIGYSDMLYFSRCFHRHFGICPTEYRKKPITIY